MRVRSLIITFALFLSLFSGEGARVWAEDNQGQNERARDTELLEFRKVHGKEQDTHYLLDQQNRRLESGDRSAETLQKAKNASETRADEIVNLLKDEQLQKAMKKISDKGTNILKENPELQSPIAVIAGAVSLWYGRTVRLLRTDDFKILSRVKGRNRESELSVESKLLDGTLRYQPSDGMDISINRKISSIGTSAGLNYSVKNKTGSAQVHHQLAPNIDLSFGTSQGPDSSQMDNRAGVNYQINF